MKKHRDRSIRLARPSRRRRQRVIATVLALSFLFLQVGPGLARTCAVADEPVDHTANPARAILDSPEMIEVEAELRADGCDVMRTGLDRPSPGGPDVQSFLVRRTRPLPGGNEQSDTWSNSDPVLLMVGLSEQRIAYVAQFRIDHSSGQIRMELRLPECPDARIRVTLPSRPDAKPEAGIYARHPNGSLQLLAIPESGSAYFVNDRNTPIPEELRWHLPNLVCMVACLVAYLVEPYAWLYKVAKCMIAADILSSVKKSEALDCMERYLSVSEFEAEWGGSLWPCIAGCL